MKNNKKEYIAPQLNTVSFRTESGFAISDPTTFTLWFEDDHSDVENYSISNGWTEDGNSFWGN